MMILLFGRLTSRPRSKSKQAASSIFNNNNNNNNNNNKNNNEARRPDIVFLDKKEGEVIITALVLPPLVMTG